MLSTDHVMKLEFKPNLGYNVLRILSSSQTLEIFGTRHVESWCLIKSPRLKIYLIQKKKKTVQEAELVLVTSQESACCQWFKCCSSLQEGC